MYKILKDSKYSPDKITCVCVNKGDIVELPEGIANAWISNGRCELAKKKKPVNPVEKTAVVDPVKETKAKKKKK